MLTLRKALPADLELLRQWQRQPHVQQAGASGDWGWETELLREPPWREFLIAELAGKPIGFMQIIDPQLEDSHYWGEIAAGHRAVDIWIGEVDELGKGHGSHMMRLALARCFAAPEVHTVLIDPLMSNARARRFYERLGFRFLEQRMFDDDDCAVLQLTRADWMASLAAEPPSEPPSTPGGA